MCKACLPRGIVASARVSRTWRASAERRFSIMRSRRGLSLVAMGPPKSEGSSRWRNSLRVITSSAALSSSCSSRSSLSSHASCHIGSCTSVATHSRQSGIPPTASLTSRRCSTGMEARPRCWSTNAPASTERGGIMRSATKTRSPSNQPGHSLVASTMEA